MFLICFYIVVASPPQGMAANAIETEQIAIIAIHVVSSSPPLWMTLHWMMSTDVSLLSLHSCGLSSFEGGHKYNGNRTHCYHYDTHCLVTTPLRMTLHWMMASDVSLLCWHIPGRSQIGNGNKYNGNGIHCHQYNTHCLIITPLWMTLHWMMSSGVSLLCRYSCGPSPIVDGHKYNGLRTHC